VVPPAARRLLAPLKGIVQPYRRTRFFVAVRSLIARRLRYPPLTPDLRQRLEAYYATDIACLAEMLQRDLSIWVSGSARGVAAIGDADADPLAADHAVFGRTVMPESGA
jgi:hypothetical protein